MTLQDPEAAEVAVVELAGASDRRPSIAAIREAYRDVVRRWTLEDRHRDQGVPQIIPGTSPAAGLPATPDLAWSPLGASWAQLRISGVRAGLPREEDVIRAEQQAREEYMGLGATLAERSRAVVEMTAGLTRKFQDRVSVGGNSEYGRVCGKHNRWVGRQQMSDPCWSDAWREVLPEAQRDELERVADKAIQIPPCPYCQGQDTGPCSHFAQRWREELSDKIKAEFRRRSEARDKLRAEAVSP